MRLPTLRLTILIALVGLPSAAIYYLLHPILLCVREWGTFANDCRETLYLTLAIPMPIFFSFWILLLVAYFALGRKKRSL